MVFFGQFLTDYLTKRSWPIIAGTRSGRNTGINSLTQIAYGSLPELLDLSKVLGEVKVIVHCAARAHIIKDEHDDPLSEFRKTNRDGTLAFAHQAAKAGVKRFIFLSSIGVNGNITYDTPFKVHDQPAPHAPYAVSKLEAEIGLVEIAKQTGLEVIILRPPLIFGPNPVGNLGTISRILSKNIPLPFSLVTKNKRSLVSVNTLASLIEVCLSHSNAVGKTFFVSDGLAMHTRGVIERVAQETKQNTVFFPVPIFILRLMLKFIGKTHLDSQLFGNLEVDISKTTEQLGWVPPKAHDSTKPHNRDILT